MEAIFCHLRAFGPAIKGAFWDHLETAVLGQILARSLLEAMFCHLRAFGPAIKGAFWDHLETAVLGQILARSLLEPDFGTLAAYGPAIKTAFWDHWETAVLGQILAGSLLEAIFCHLKAFRPAIKGAFWDHWETASFGPNLGRGAFWKQISAICGPVGRQLKSPSGTIGKTALWAKSWSGPFWKHGVVWLRLLGCCTRQKEEATQKKENQKEGEHHK